jgi:hypothetical protein
MSDEKKDNKTPSMKSLFNQAREINRKEQLEKEKKEQETMKKQQEEDEKQREEYATQLYQDKINILKDKSSGDFFQGNSSYSEKRHYTVKQKISNFFYHNKWWLGIGCFFVFVAVYVIYDVVTTVKPDMTVMLLVNDEKLYECTADMQEIFGEYAGDRNGDGEIKVNIFYMPISDYIYQNQPEMYVSSTTHLTSLLQTDDNLLIIADTESSETLTEDDVLFSLEKYFSDNENVKDTGFYLANTSFAEKIGYQGEKIADDVYIGIRKVQTGTSYEESMREEFNLDFEVLKNIINDFSE